MGLFVAPKTLLFVALLGTFIGGAHAQDGRQDAPGRFDYYVLSLSWSPSFCETATGNARLRGTSVFFRGARSMAAIRTRVSRILSVSPAAARSQYHAEHAGFDASAGARLP